MTILVGFSPHNDDLGALDLACQLARSEGTDVRVVSVVPQGWPTVVAGDTDREYRAWAAQEGRMAEATATAYLTEHPDVPATVTWTAGPSVPPVLLDAVREQGADLLVVGSGEDVGHGQIGLTSKTDRILHSSAVPVAVAPRGYQAGEGSTVRRITLGFRGDTATWTLLERVATIARSSHASLRVVTFAVRSRTMYPPRVSGAEDMVLAAWVEAARQEQSRADAHLRQQGFPGADLTLDVVVGRSWGGAMDSLDWDREDVLVVGSSSTHRMRRVFLGSSAAKILRHSSVPVVVVP